MNPSRTLTLRKGQFIFVSGDVEKQITLKAAATKFRKYADKKAKSVLKKISLVRHSYSCELPNFLDNHQERGVLWILSRSRSYLAHAPGAGKTLQAIIAALSTGFEGQVLFIVPPQLTENWARELLKWSNKINPFKASYSAIIPDSSEKDTFEFWHHEFIICPDSMITKPWVLKKLLKIKWRFIAVDEASRFKESTSQRTLALFGGILNGKSTPGIVSNCPHVTLLDGSPMPNRPMELWAPIYAMAPYAIDYKSQQDFGFRYCGAKFNGFGWEYKGATHQEELKANLQKDFMHVVTEEELDHPERKRSMMIMSEDVRSLAQKTWEKENLSKIKLSDLSEDESKGELARFRRELGLKKVPWISNYVSYRLKEKNESILLFAWHREVIDKLAHDLVMKAIPCRVIMGGTKADFREESFKLFNSGKTRLLIMNIAAGGRGHNLQKADRVIFGEYSWTDELNKQCEKRASRKGRDKDLPVRCDYIVAPHSLDEPIAQSLFRKAENVKRIIG